jgi:hypothetical protein
MTDWHPDTWLIASGRNRTPGEPLNVPPVFASNFYLPTTASTAVPRAPRRPTRSNRCSADSTVAGRWHSRRGWRQRLSCSSVSPSASHIAVPTDPYHGVAGIVAEGEQQGRWTVRRLDQADTAAWVDAVGDCDLVWLESPENPLITVADLPTICSTPRSPDTIVAVDSTFATPLNQQPLALGADVVMHSATKFIGGHSDLLAGVLVVDRRRPVRRVPPASPAARCDDRRDGGLPDDPGRPHDGACDSTGRRPTRWNSPRRLDAHPDLAGCATQGCRAIPPMRSRPLHVRVRRDAVVRDHRRRRAATRCANASS